MSMSEYFSDWANSRRKSSDDSAPAEDFGSWPDSRGRFDGGGAGVAEDFGSWPNSQRRTGDAGINEIFESWGKGSGSSSVGVSGGGSIGGGGNKVDGVADEAAPAEATADDLEYLLLLGIFDMPGFEITVPSGDRKGERITIGRWVEEEEITDPDLIARLFTTTEYWQATNTTMRSWDQQWFSSAGARDPDETTEEHTGYSGVGEWEISEDMTPDQLEMLKPALDWIDGMGLGVDFSEQSKLKAAFQIMRFGTLHSGEGREVISRAYEQASGFTLGSAESLDASPALSAVETQIRAAAASWMVPLNGDTMQSMVTRVWESDNPQAEIGLLTEQFRQQAEGAYPALKEMIERGISPEQYFAPYQSIASELLERPVDFLSNDRSLFDSIASTTEQRPMTFTEARKHIKSSDEWQGTAQARGEYSDMVHGLAQMFGRVA